MMYQHESREKHHPKGGVSKEAPPPPAWNKLSEADMVVYLQQRGLCAKLAIQNGWYPTYYKGVRVVIPAITQLAHHRYWQARTLDNNPLRYASPYGPRRDALIRLTNTQINTPTVYICEGPMDALALAEIPGAMAYAFMGINPSSEQILHLLLEIQCFQPKDVVCVADKDNVHGMMMIQSRLAIRGVRSRIKIPLDKKDIACYTLRERMEIVR